MRIYLPWFHVSNLQSNLDRFKRDVACAAEHGCDAAIFPEQFLTGYHGPGDPNDLRLAFAETSRNAPGMLLFCGTISEDGHNRQYIYRDNEQVAFYDKVHLFHPNNEQEMWTPGERYVAVSHKEWRIGLITCNDVRFPEQVRALKLEHDINVLICPALWPAERDHVISALLKARAIENGIYVVGCCVARVDNGIECFDGARNHVFDPLGDPLQADGYVYELDPASLSDVLVDTRAQFRKVSSVEII